MDKENHKGERARRQALAQKNVGLMVQEATSRSSNAKDRVSNLFLDTNLLPVAVAIATAVRLYLFVNYYTINNDGVLYIQSARDF